VHLALLELAKTDPSVISPDVLAGVILIADPAKFGNDKDTLWQDGDVPAGAGVENATGIWTRFAEAVENNEAPYGRLPSVVDSQTVEICHNHDPVCAPGLFTITDIEAHEDYTASEESGLGDWVADKVYLDLGG
jgi:hypothetical protein